MLLLNYDVAPMEMEPKPTQLGGFLIPATSAKIQVRRRLRSSTGEHVELKVL
jgi:hypothetical protein